MKDKTQNTPRQDIVAFLNDISNVHADRVNPAFKSRYASLSEILDTVKEVAARHRLAVFQRSSNADGYLRVTTYFLHTENEVEYDAGFLAHKVEGMTTQQLGSSLTYLRRQSLQTSCGISVDLDDDANKSSNTKVKNAGPWFAFIPADIRPKAIDYLRNKCWIGEGGLLDDLPDDKQEIISAQQAAFLKAIQK